MVIWSPEVIIGATVITNHCLVAISMELIQIIVRFGFEEC